MCVIHRETDNGRLKMEARSIWIGATASAGISVAKSGYAVIRHDPISSFFGCTVECVDHGDCYMRVLRIYELEFV